MVEYPDDWQEKSLLDCVSLIQGLTYTPDNVKRYGTLVLRSSNIQGNHLSFDDNVYVDTYVSSEKWVQSGDVLVCVRNGSATLIGKSCVLPELKNTTFGAFMSVLRGDETGFIAKVFESDIVQDQVKGRSSATINQITKKDFESIRIHVPESPEIIRIADALKTFDEYITSLSELIEKKRAIRDGAMTDLLSGATRLEGCVSKWGKTTIGSCADIYQGGTPKTTNSSYWNGNIIWVTPGEVTQNGSLFIYDSERKITESGVRNSSARILPEGTILLCTRATIGTLAIAGRAMATNQGFKNLICKRGIDNVFFAYLLLTLKSEMIRRAIGTTFLEISKSALSSIEITIPEYGEQKAIASVLTAMEEEIQSLEEERNKMIQIRKGAMDDLLTGQVRLTK